MLATVLPTSFSPFIKVFFPCQLEDLHMDKDPKLQFSTDLEIQKTKIMASGPITSWEIDGETVSDFILGGSKITADGDCSHEIKRRLLLGRKVMTNLDRIFKSIDITLPTKVHLVSSGQFSSVAQSCLTLCNPMNRSMPGLPVHHHLPEFTQTPVHRVSDAIQLCHPRSSPPASNPSQHQRLFQ